MSDKEDKMLNVRIDERTNQKLAAYSQDIGTTKSAVVKEALAMYFSNKHSKHLPYVLGQDLFGVAASGRTDTSTTYKAKLKAKLNEKHAH